MEQKENIIIIKRDGTVAEFDLNRIIHAIKKASERVSMTSRTSDQVIPDEEVIRIASAVQQEISRIEQPNISQIQKSVEEKLMQTYPEVARAYIEYRHDRDVARERNSKLNQDIKGLIEQSDVSLLNENANKDSRIIPTQRDLLAGIIAKHYAKTHILPRDVVEAHEKGEIHYHDLDYSPFFPMFNCMLVDLKGMLSQGFKMGNAEIETPKSINTATAVTAQIIAQVASHIYGGTSINRIDEVLAPYVQATYEKHLAKADKWNIADREGFAMELTEKDCFDAFQSLEYDINTLHTSNGQTPFVTFGFGLGESWQARLIQQSILKNRINGLGKHHKTPVFPKLVFTLKRGLNLEKTDPNYDIKQLALKCTSKQMYPDIINYDQVVKITGSFKAPMGCRSFLGELHTS